MALGARIKQVRDERNISRKQLADMIDWTEEAIGTLENRDSEKSKYSLQIARALQIDLDWLMSGEGSQNPIYKKPSARFIKVKGSANMDNKGYWQEIDYDCNDGDGYLEVRNASEKAYAIRPINDSLFPTVRAGWYIIFDPKNTPKTTEYVHVVLQNGQNMIKEFINCQYGILNLNSVNGDERLSLATKEVQSITPFIEIQPPSRLLNETYVNNDSVIAL